jgi:hypothetical protein
MTQTTTDKELIKKSYENEKNRVLLTINRRSADYKKREAAFDLYISHMQKVSKDFELVKKPKVENFNVYLQNFPVESLKVTYNECEIIYTGKLPENTSRSSFRVDVSEHYVSSRNSYGSRNEGYKVRTFINYEEGRYCKNGATVAKKILEFINNKFEAQKREEAQKNLNKRAYQELVKQYPWNYIETDYRNGSKFTIHNGNDTSVSVGYLYNPEDETFEFLVDKINIKTDRNLKNLVEGLGRIQK